MAVKIDGNGSVQGTQGMQIGTSVTATNNFTFQVPTTPDGTMTLSRGNVNAPNSTLMFVDNGNNVIITSLLCTIPLPVSSGGTGDNGSAWTQAGASGFVPGTGGFGSATGLTWYKRIGKTVFFNASLTITTNGTGASSVNLTMPFNCLNGAVFCGREDAVSGKMVQGVIKPNTSTMNIFNYDNTYPGANGAVLRINGVYETNAA